MDLNPSPEIVRQAKVALRRRMRTLRAALPGPAVIGRSQRIIRRLLELDAVRQARNVGLFSPIAGRGEVDVRELDVKLRAQHKAIYYPFMDPTVDGYRTGFRHVNESSELAPLGQRFDEPPRDAREANPAELDLLIVPALAASPTGHRLGQGSGFYDATLPDQCPPGEAIVVVFHFQLLAELPIEPHDRQADWVVTDEVALRTSYAAERIG